MPVTKTEHAAVHGQGFGGWEAIVVGQSPRQALYTPSRHSSTLQAVHLDDVTLKRGIGSNSLSRLPNSPGDSLAGYIRHEGRTPNPRPAYVQTPGVQCIYLARIRGQFLRTTAPCRTKKYLAGSYPTRFKKGLHHAHSYFGAHLPAKSRLWRV